MEIVIKNQNAQVLIDRTDNGVILLDIAEDGVVVSKSCFELYFRDGNLDFDNIGSFFHELMSVLKFPTEDKEFSLEVMIVPVGDNLETPPAPENDDEDDD